MTTLPDAVISDTRHSPAARLRQMPVSAVTLTDSFWEPRLKTNRETTLPSQFKHLEDTGALDNFRRASGRKTGLEFQGMWFRTYLKMPFSSVSTEAKPFVFAILR